MAFIWMRQYPTVIHLAEMFGVDKATVSLEIHHVIPILRFHLQNEIVWMSMEEAQVLRGSWPSFPNAVFALDATIHPVWKPLIHQSWYYRGDKKRHCLITQIIVSPAGVVINMEAGYLGTNDTGAYNLSEFGQGNYGLPDWRMVAIHSGFLYWFPTESLPYKEILRDGLLTGGIDFIARWLRGHSGKLRCLGVAMPLGGTPNISKEPQHTLLVVLRISK